MERKKTVCFSGHRPEKLTASKDAVIYTLGNAIEQAYQDGYICVITPNVWSLYGMDNLLELRIRFATPRRWELKSFFSNRTHEIIKI